MSALVHQILWQLFWCLYTLFGSYISFGQLWWWIRATPGAQLCTASPGHGSTWSHVNWYKKHHPNQRSIAPQIILHNLCRWAPTDDNHKPWMGYFSVDTTSISIKKTETLIAEKSTLIKIVTNKHIVMFVLDTISNRFAESWLILTASICLRHSLFTSTRIHVEMIVHALSQMEMQACTKSPDPRKH